jgi:hypothetical protein
MIRSDVMLAWIDDFDPGTVWEIGYFAGYREGMVSGRMIIAFTIHGYGLNLMLSQSVNGVVSGLDAVKALFSVKEPIPFSNAVHQLIWHGKEL